jgi:chloramphenicol 3-O phosphotransferase
VNQGTLIVLNGGSSAGKTSIAEALQDMLDEPYLLMGVDVLYRSLPPTQKDPRLVDPRCYSVETTIENGKEYFRVIPGPVLDAFVYAHYRSIARMLELGVNIISDQVLWSREWLLDAVRAIQPFHAFMIEVFASAEEAERRHRARGRSGAEWHRGSARLTHSEVLYDSRIDTTSRRLVRKRSKYLSTRASGLLRLQTCEGSWWSRQPHLKRTPNDDFATQVLART